MKNVNLLTLTIFTTEDQRNRLKFKYPLIYIKLIYLIYLTTIKVTHAIKLKATRACKGTIEGREGKEENSVIIFNFKIKKL